MPRAKDVRTEWGRSPYIGIAIVLTVGLLLLLMWPKQPVLTANLARYKLEVVSTPQQREQGLSNRDYLARGAAMLFVYQAADAYCFWMKDMRFSLDIVWLDDAKKVVHIERNVSPATYPHSLCPSKLARYVLEFNAGEAARIGLQPGTQVSF